MEEKKTWINKHPILFAVILIFGISMFGGVILSFKNTDGSNLPSDTNQEGYKPTKLDATTPCKNLTYENLVCHPDSIGNYICQSIVYNNCDETADYVEVIGTYFDKNGQFIGTSWTYTNPSTILGHSSSPFTLYTTENGVIFDTYKIQLAWD